MIVVTDGACYNDYVQTIGRGIWLPRTFREEGAALR
jgi:hypothetical protein